MYTIYLEDKDLLKPEHFPVIALLNEASNSNILEFAENISNGVGIGYNYSTCTFWNDLDEYEQANTSKFDGLWVANEAGEEVNISLHDLEYYLEILYARLSSTQFSDLPKLRQILDQFKARI